MNTIVLEVENIKCHGCANTVKREIKKLPGVVNVEVIVEKGEVSIQYNGEEDMTATILGKLKKLGYPEKGKGNLGTAVKSFVSCAIGRITPEE